MMGGRGRGCRGGGGGVLRRGGRGEGLKFGGPLNVLMGKGGGGGRGKAAGSAELLQSRND